jgi:hypothetical protein
MGIRRRFLKQFSCRKRRYGKLFHASNDRAIWIVMSYIGESWFGGFQPGID